MTCHFCEDIFFRNRQQGLPEEASVIYQDENIYVMPDISPLCIGHMLIVTKKHCRGFANAGSAAVDSAEAFLREYRKKIGYRDYTIFEHGAVCPYGGGASIDHAHIHIVPFALPMEWILNCDFGESKSYSLSELKLLGEEKQSYLYFKRGREEKGRAYPVGIIKSQYLRDAANRLIEGREDYNWKANYKNVSSYAAFIKTIAWWENLDSPLTFKWKKKLILEKYGLSNYQELVEETVRFPVSKKELVISLLEKELECTNGNYYRLVLVPLEHRYKLPNYVLKKKEDLQGLADFLEEKKDYQEIWYFTGSSKAKGREFSGRISFVLDGLGTAQVIEMISGDDPRLIEKYTMGNTKINYCRLVKKNGDSNYQIEEMQVHVDEFTGKTWWDCVCKLQEELRLYQDNLFIFGGMVRKYGIRSLSIDFRYAEKKFSFIDWDTSDDKTILNYEIR